MNGQRACGISGWPRPPVSGWKMVPRINLLTDTLLFHCVRNPIYCIRGNCSLSENRLPDLLESLIVSEKQ
jgi:hypothetical protein